MSLPDNVLRHFNVINLILLAAVFFIYAIGVHPLLTTDPVTPSLKSMKPLQAASSPVAVDAAGGQGERRVPPLLDYVAVSEQNLFHPFRKIPASTAKEVQAVRPDLVLHGTLISEGMEVAYVTDRRSPRSSPGRGERQTVLKKGDLVGGYQLSEINPDRIVLLKGEDRLVVTLDHPGKRGGGSKVLRR